MVRDSVPYRRIAVPVVSDEPTPEERAHTIAVTYANELGNCKASDLCDMITDAIWAAVRADRDQR